MNHDGMSLCVKARGPHITRQSHAMCSISCLTQSHVVPHGLAPRIMECTLSMFCFCVYTYEKSAVASYIL